MSIKSETLTRLAATQREIAADCAAHNADCAARAALLVAEQLDALARDDESDHTNWINGYRAEIRASIKKLDDVISARKAQDYLDKIKQTYDRKVS